MESKDSIITLQLGHYANHVGAHFWNTQEACFVYPEEGNFNPDELEINHGVLFREGRTRLGEVTFTPRMVSVDLKNALGSMPVHGDLYERPLRDPDQLEKLQGGVNWSGDVQMRVDDKEVRNNFLQSLDQQEQPSTAQDFVGGEEGDKGQVATNCSLKEQLDLEGQVRVWSDFLRTRYHPRTNVVVQDYQHGDFTVNPFDTFGLGYNAGNDLLEEIEDRVRYFAEEADSLRGFHLLADGHTGFGGLSVRVAGLLSEDYGSSKTVLALPVTPSLPDMTDAMRDSGLVPAVHCLSMFLNGALAVHGLTGSCGLTSPLSLLKDTFPLLKTGSDHVRQFGSTGGGYQPQLSYHSSALIAGTLDTLTLPWRSYNGSAPMASLIHELNRGGRSMAAVAAALPAWQNPNHTLVEHLSDLEARGLTLNSHATSLTPGCHDVTTGIDTQIVSLRGIDRTMVRPANFESIKGKYAKVDQLGVALFKHYDSVRLHTRSLFSIQSPLPLKCPFPKIFDAGKLGQWKSAGTGAGGGGGVSSMAIWHSSERGIGQSVKSWAARAAKINLNKLPKFQDCGLEQDSLLQTVEELTQLSECYKMNTGY